MYNKNDNIKNYEEEVKKKYNLVFLNCLGHAFKTLSKGIPWLPQSGCCKLLQTPSMVRKGLLATLEEQTGGFALQISGSRPLSDVRSFS